MEFFKKTLDPVIALAAIAVLDVFLFLIVGAWTVGGGETMMTGLMAQGILGDELERVPFWNLVFPPDAGYWKIYISLGMLFGAFAPAEDPRIAVAVFVEHGQHGSSAAAPIAQRILQRWWEKQQPPAEDEAETTLARALARPEVRRADD